MAFVDWTFYNHGTTVLNLVTLPPAPVGTRWLHFDSKNPGIGPGDMLAVPRNPPYPSQGVTRGYLRTLVRYNTSQYDSAVGLSCMCSVEDMYPGEFGREGYSAVLEYRSGVRRVQLKQWSAGMYGSGEVTLATSPANVWLFETLYALELSWYLDLLVLNGIVLTVKIGTASDYSDLAPVPNLNEVLLTGPSVYTNAAAVNVFVLSSSTPGLHVYFDQTSLGTL